MKLGTYSFKKKKIVIGRGFSGGPVVTNPPGNAEDTSSILDLGRTVCFRAAKPIHNYEAVLSSPGATTGGATAIRSPNAATGE